MKLEVAREGNPERLRDGDVRPLDESRCELEFPPSSGTARLALGATGEAVGEIRGYRCAAVAGEGILELEVEVDNGTEATLVLSPTWGLLGVTGGGP